MYKQFAGLYEILSEPVDGVTTTESGNTCKVGYNLLVVDNEPSIKF